MVMHPTVLMHPMKEAMVMHGVMVVLASACLNSGWNTQSCPRNSQTYKDGFEFHVVSFSS